MIKRQTLRYVSLFALIITAVIGAFLYYTKYNVSKMRTNLAHMNREIIKVKDEVHVLKAEWVYLNKPSRLKKLNDTYGRLKPVKVMQVASIEGFDKATKGFSRTMLASLDA